MNVSGYGISPRVSFLSFRHRRNFGSKTIRDNPSPEERDSNLQNCYSLYTYKSTLKLRNSEVILKVIFRVPTV